MEKRAKNVSTRYRDSSGSVEYSLLPRSCIAELTAPITFASASIPLRQILGQDLSAQFLLKPGAQYVDLLPRHRVQPRLDHIPNRSKPPRRVDDVRMAQALRVVVLRHLGQAPDVAVDSGDLAGRDAGDVDDGADRVDEGALLARAGWETRVCCTFVLYDAVGE